MKTSNVITNIALRYNETAYHTNEEDMNPDFPIDDKLVNKAIQSICQSWNESDKSQKFIRHLISAFLPVKPWAKIATFPEEEIKANKNRCAINRIKLTGLLNIAEQLAPIKTEMVFHRAKCSINPENVEENEKARLEIVEKFNKLPIEIRTGSVAHCSEKSNKYLSKEAILALTLIVQEAILYGDDDINFIVKKMMISERNNNQPKPKRLTPKQTNQVVRGVQYGLHGCVDDETKAKLLALKGE